MLSEQVVALEMSSKDASLLLLMPHVANGSLAPLTLLQLLQQKATGPGDTKSVGFVVRSLKNRRVVSRGLVDAVRRLCWLPG